MSAHAFLPPSGAKAWSRCALWPSMNKQFPQDDSPASIEGTAAHWVASEMQDARCHNPKEGTATPNGVIVTGEMLDGAELLCDTITARMGWVGVNVEKRVAIPSLPGEQFGTPDYWIFKRAIQRLEIVDYKFGHGFVDEYFNEQGMLYALGIIASIVEGWPGATNVGDWTIAFTIVQPRCYHRGSPVRTHEYTVAELYQRVQALRDAANAAYEPSPFATTNPECCHCPGRHACDALQRAAYSDAEFSSRNAPHDLTPAAASLELRMLERAYERLGARVDGLRELVIANIRNGLAVPHHKLEAGRGSVRWTAEPDRIILIGKMLGKDLSKPGVVTPTQAKKLGIDDSVISAYSQNIPGAQKLISENNSEASKAFGK